jgi:hypothetical protein
VRNAGRRVRAALRVFELVSQTDLQLELTKTCHANRVACPVCLDSSDDERLCPKVAEIATGEKSAQSAVSWHVPLDPLTPFQAALSDLILPLQVRDHQGRSRLQ